MGESFGDGGCLQITQFHNIAGIFVRILVYSRVTESHLINWGLPVGWVDKVDIVCYSRAFFYIVNFVGFVVTNCTKMRKVINSDWTM